MKTLEQELASKIYIQVKAFGDEHPKESLERNKYGAMSYKLPILVRTAGLVQALSFVDSRGQPPHHKLLEHLAQVVVENDKKTFLDKSRKSDLQEYTYLTLKTMLALKWYKRFAQSVLEVVPTDEVQGD